MIKPALVIAAALVALTIASAPSTPARKTKTRPREGSALELKLAAKLECRYDRETRKAVARFYRLGKKAEKPLSKAITNGTCTLRGFGK